MSQHINKNLPTCNSATFRVNPSSTTFGLLPFEFAAKMVIFNPRPEFNPETWNIKEKNPFYYILNTLIQYFSGQEKWSEIFDLKNKMTNKLTLAGGVSETAPDMKKLS